MKVHANAALGPAGRIALVQAIESGMTSRSRRSPWRSCESGVQLAKGRRREKRARFVEAVLDAVSIEPYDLNVAEVHGDLLAHVRQAGTLRGAHDLIIAATARAQERQVVSSDKGAFAELPGVSIAGGSG